MIAYTSNAVEHINKYLPADIELIAIKENTIYFNLNSIQYKHIFRRKELIKIDTYHELALLIIDVITEYWKDRVYAQLVYHVLERKL